MSVNQAYEGPAYTAEEMQAIRKKLAEAKVTIERLTDEKARYADLIYRLQNRITKAKEALEP